MKITYLIVALLAATVIMQGVILYRDYSSSSGGLSNASAIRDAPNGTSISFAGLPVEGDNSAQVALIEFSDFECPFCERHATGVAKEIEKEFIETGKVRHAFANNPLPTHPNAKFLATAAICAGQQGYYWEMNRLLFERKARTKPEVAAVAHNLQIDEIKFQLCIEGSPDVARVITHDMERAKEFKLSGTPAFAIGVVDSNGVVVIRKFIVGAQPFNVFKEVIDGVISTLPKNALLLH